MKGHKRFRAGAWRLTVNAKDPVTGKRKPVYRTVHAPDTKRGAAKADTELAKLIAEVETGRTMPTSGLTVEQLVERYIVDKAPSWSPGAADETRRRVTQHITPHVGSIAIERLRPIDVQQLHAALRAGGLGEGSIGRMHDVLRAALNWAERLDLIVKNPAAKVDRPRGAKPDITPPAPADVVRMIAEASPALAVFLRLAALTGARRGQLCGLHWADVDLDAATIRWTRALGKIPGGTVEKETKTGARWPVALDAVTVELLRAHRRRCVESALGLARRYPAMPTCSPATPPAASRGTRTAHPSDSRRYASASVSTGSGCTTFGTGWLRRASAKASTSRPLPAAAAGRTPPHPWRSTPTSSRPATASWPAGSPSSSTASEQQSPRPVTWAGRRSMAAHEQSWPPVPMRSVGGTLLGIRTFVRYRPVMDAEQVNQLAARHAVLVTTAMHMQHPGDDFERWHRGWVEVNRLVDEINGLLMPQPGPPA